ncbi:phosphatase PAP2 family protein [Candidatus Neomarinimicrobiota bacterium]
MNQSKRHHFDRLILWYLGIVMVLTLVGSYFGLLYLVTAMMHLIMIIMVFRITDTHSISGPRAWLRWCYPLLLMLPLHYEIELVGTLFHAGTIYDRLVLAWDQWLFRGHPHRYLPDVLPGPWWREMLHFFYCTYYLVVAGGFFFAWRKGGRVNSPEESVPAPFFYRYTFVFLGTFCTYMLIFIAFPVVGPLDDRFLRFSNLGIIGPLIDLIYTAGDSAGGAFPSSHVGEAVVVYLLLQPRKPWVRAVLIAIITGLTFATVYGSFHYAIDALAGLVTGPIFYLFWSWIYRQLRPETASPVPTLEPVRGVEPSNL